jgi:hypothetical protein
MVAFGQKHGGLKIHASIEASFIDLYKSLTLNLIFKVNDPENCDAVLDWLWNIKDETSYLSFEKINREDLQKILHMPPKASTTEDAKILLNQKDKYLLPFNGLLSDLEILLTLKFLRYNFWPNSGLTKPQRDIKLLMKEYFERFMSNKSEVGQVVTIENVQTFPCVLKLLGGKTLDSVIVADAGNFMVLEHVNPAKNKYKVLMKEKISLVVLEADGHVVKCRKVHNKKGIELKFTRREGSLQMVRAIGEKVEEAKRGEICFLGECLETWDEDLKYINSGK